MQATNQPAGEAVYSRGRIVVDLSRSAALYDKYGIRPRRALARIVAAVGAIFLSLVPALELAGTPVFRPPYDLAFSLIAVVFGAVIVLVGLWAYQRLPEAASRLTIDSVGLTLLGIDGREFVVEWSRSSSVISIYDWRSVPDAIRARGLQGVEFVLSPPLPVEAAIQSETASAILRSAEQAGWSVRGWVALPPPKGPQRLVELVPPPRRT